MEHNKIPILYLYIFRHVVNLSNGNTIIESNVLHKAMRKVIYKAPAAAYCEFYKELEELGLIAKINKQCYKILINQNGNTLFKNLKNHVFPI